ncbi:HAD family hydrolase [Halobacillus naozhouensis]|uniref:HAD family hydrolase n=1 Tax=Halobacillus naozhouensis TaxID=554880 RepID=A0ABY8J1H4_9BACI|nr:HAD family hydrolase [Halobacillus naozhouensis]WFT76352.1 HAD family hydrolase [Halobacillus naozhouensis]
MIKTVLFDLDGTLLDRDASLNKFIESQYERLIEWLGHISKQNYMQRFTELDNRGYVWKDKVYQQLVMEYDIKDITWEELLQDYLDHFKENCVPFPHLIRTLKQLKKRNFSIGIITNGKGKFQMDNIKVLGIDNYTDIILVSEWEGVKKPDPIIFKRALAQLNVSPEESIFVGDHLEKDVQAAQKVGMKGVWKRNDHWEKELQTDLIVDDLAEVLTITNKLNSVLF